MTAYLSNNYHKVRSVHLTEQYYREAVENVASYNSRLCSEKRQRLPFLDSQTGVAQNHSNLWIPYRFRCTGRRHGQIYSYPAQRWKKKCSLPLPDIPLPRIKSTEVDLIETEFKCVQNGNSAIRRFESISHFSSKDIHPITAVENTVASVDSDSKDVDDSMSAPTAAMPVTSGSVYHDEYYNDWENVSEPPDAGEIDHRNSDSSDYEETYVKKRKRRDNRKRPSGAAGGANNSTGSRSRKKEKDAETSVDRDKPFACESTAKRAVAAAASISAAAAKATSNGSNGSSSGATKYCDFCLGDELENKKTGSREEMVSCADCGRCGHPSCLQFTPNMIISVKKYPWQCIECKSCGICGTSDNDDQLLFCDDCDRGYHMYCLSPPLSEPPEGSWSCHLCIEEFYGGHKPDMIAVPSSSEEGS